MGKQLTKECLQKIVDGINCHYERELFVIDSKDNKFIIVNNLNDYITKLHISLKQLDDTIELSIHNYNEDKESKIKTVLNKFTNTIDITDQVLKCLVNAKSIYTSIYSLFDDNLVF